MAFFNWKMKDVYSGYRWSPDQIQHLLNTAEKLTIKRCSLKVEIALNTEPYCICLFFQSYCILVPRVTAVRTGQRKHLFWHSSRWYSGYHRRLLCWRNAHPQHGGNHGRGQQSDHFQRQCLLDPRRDGERPPPHLSLLTLLICNGMVRCAEIPQDWSTSDMGGEFLVSVTLSS